MGDTCSGISQIGKYVFGFVEVWKFFEKKKLWAFRGELDKEQ